MREKCQWKFGTLEIYLHKLSKRWKVPNIIWKIIPQQEGQYGRSQRPGCTVSNKIPQYIKYVFTKKFTRWIVLNEEYFASYCVIGTVIAWKEVGCIFTTNKHMHSRVFITKCMFTHRWYMQSVMWYDMQQLIATAWHAYSQSYAA